MMDSSTKPTSGFLETVAVSIVLQWYMIFGGKDVRIMRKQSWMLLGLLWDLVLYCCDCCIVFVLKASNGYIGNKSSHRA